MPGMDDDSADDSAADDTEAKAETPAGKPPREPSLFDCIVPLVALVG